MDAVIHSLSSVRYTQVVDRREKVEYAAGYRGTFDVKWLADVPSCRFWK